jgi:putative Mg2+ transporter-C (MgtC) family protein
LVSTELEIGYVVSLTCRAPDEAHVRALLLQGLVGSGLALRGLDSNDVDAGARVAVTAHLTASNRVDAERRKDRRAAQPRAGRHSRTLAGRTSA